MSGTTDRLHDRLRAYEGAPATRRGQGKDPVNAPMIRHWCEAIGHPPPPDGTAPPTMLQVWTMAGLTGHTDRAGPFDALLRELDAAGFTSVVATDCEQEYLRPLRTGDRIAFDAVVESVSPRKTTKLGTGYFVTTRTEVWSGGERVGTHRFRILKYAPAHVTPPGSPARTGDQVPAKSSSHGGGSPSAASALRPRPVVNRDNAGFWEGVARHELLIQRCTGCGLLRFPWLPGCNGCGSADWDTVRASGAGRVHSYVVMHHPPFPAFSPPYAVALVELAEGVRMISDITGVRHDQVRIGMPVDLEFLAVDDELTLPVFRGARSATEGEVRATR
ncbi:MULTISPECIES: Zn-ribbon domain-containing OB-fold protein [Streptomycetaceae]|uniref:OB-fold protein n=1 Tax=Streptantibioticus cattleyicolor (strain ATCC 35852 / DSM 46488 / JCM 4925 / NBRC 14057 / NRRL 8057) TaxID=1003195 RepID=F8JR64_STREN|nr:MULTISPECIES: OB-fold domain-containing protein [Streptomycetaceae]AEW95362.1 hypothetical protein SCATT_29910 [Streptantibioticus cattleyicolor NRRL 8057 = DSM 46488]MYS59936.1 hypothetical protein [Streptomyces sp. SID5468]CCB75704.1 conserved protein of unknown function [Streptantibioticus cattleyicolor NRRL 8057 = DSM 46488]